MKNYQSVLNKVYYKVTSNKAKRHYTIVVGNQKFKTLPMSKEEFFESEYNTKNDWIDYINCNEVIILK